MKRILLVILLVLFYCCTSYNDYQYYIDKGDRIIGTLYADSLSLRYASKDMYIIKETIEGESGDYVNTHIQYYDKNKQLVAYKRISSFFNSNCYDGVLNEMTLYSVSNETLEKKKHTLYKDNGAILTDTIDCEFNYRFEYELLYNYLSE